MAYHIDAVLTKCPDLRWILLSFESVNYSYETREALKGINITLRPGTLTALIGPNGSGKTTFLKLASGLLDSYTGTIRFDERDLKKISTAERARLVSYAPSGVDFPFEFTVHEVVSQGRSPHLDMLGNLKPEDEEIVDDVIKRLSLDEFRNRSVNRLSQGERERVIIARHIAQDAPFMLFDESLAHLDLKHRLELIDEFKRLVANGKGIVVAIHEIEFAARYFQEIILLSKGEILVSGTRDRVINSGVLSDAYDLEFRIIAGKNPEELSILPSRRIN